MKNNNIFIPQKNNEFMRRLYKALIALPLISGCTHLSPIHQNNGLEQRIKVSQKLIETRKKEAESLSLEEKAKFFENKLDDFFIENYALMAREIKESGEINAELDATTSLLPMLAFKYAVKKDPKTQELASKVIDGIIALDEFETYDGYIISSVSFDEKLRCVDEKSKTLHYTQLFFAYVTANKLFDDKEIKEKIKKHTSKIADYLLKCELYLEKPNGEKISDSNIKPSTLRLSRSRCLDALVISESIKYLTNDKRFEKVLEDCVDKDYLKRIQKLQLRFLNFKIPTHSSDWLNFLRLHTLIETSASPEYKTALKKLFEKEEVENNPLFNSIFLLSNPTYEKKEQLRKSTWDILSTFPLNLTNQEIINTGVQQKLFSQRVKNKSVPESIDALPIYMRALKWNAWKDNPYRIKGNLNSKGTKRYSGIDFLLAYWMSEYEKIKEIKGEYALVVEDRKMTRDKVKVFLENQGYDVLQAGTMQEAKTIMENYEIVKIITDLDLSVISGLSGKTEGYRFLNWLHEQQEFLELKDVTLHSTVFNEGDISGILATPYKSRIKKRVQEMGYRVQPKTEILGK